MRYGVAAADDIVLVADLEAGLNDLIWVHPHADDIVLAVRRRPPGPGRGPARRVYELTDAGMAALDVSAAGVGQLGWLTGEFLRSHRIMTGPGAKP